MMQLTTVKKRELQSLKINVATHMLSYDTMNETEAIEAWHKVPELAKAFEDMAYGSILKHMKEDLTDDGFEKFLQKIELFDYSSGYAKRNVYHLMEFAGYKEEGGVIETASHYREVKKVVGKDTKEIDAVYEELDSPKTAREVKEQTQNAVTTWRDAQEKENELLATFLELRPDLRVPPYTDDKSEIDIPSKVIWKKFLSTVSHCIHPDKGAGEELQTVLNNINDYMKNEISKRNNKIAKDTLNKEFAIYKKAI